MEQKVERVVINNIIPPYVYLSNGDRELISDINGNPVKNAVVAKGTDGKYSIKGISNDSDCVGGQCPVK